MAKVYTGAQVISSAAAALHRRLGGFTVAASAISAPRIAAIWARENDTPCRAAIESPRRRFIGVVWIVLKGRGFSRANTANQYAGL
jgi:hypothetical protein